MFLLKSASLAVVLASVCSVATLYEGQNVNEIATPRLELAEFAKTQCESKGDTNSERDSLLQLLQEMSSVFNNRDEMAKYVTGYYNPEKEGGMKSKQSALTDLGISILTKIPLSNGELQQDFKKLYMIVSLDELRTNIVCSKQQICRIMDLSVSFNVPKIADVKSTLLLSKHILGSLQSKSNEIPALSRKLESLKEELEILESMIHPLKFYIVQQQNRELPTPK